MPTYLCTQQDVISKFGGQKALAECLDPDNTGAIDTAVLDQARGDASLTVIQKAGNRFQVGLDSTPDTCPPFLRMLASKLSVSECYLSGTRGQGMTQDVKDMRVEVLRELERIESGQGGVGKPETPDRVTRGPIDQTRRGTVARIMISSRRAITF